MPQLNRRQPNWTSMDMRSGDSTTRNQYHVPMSSAQRNHIAYPLTDTPSLHTQIPKDFLNYGTGIIFFVRISTIVLSREKNLCPRPLAAVRMRGKRRGQQHQRYPKHGPGPIRLSSSWFTAELHKMSNRRYPPRNRESLATGSTMWTSDCGTGIIFSRTSTYHEVEG